MNPCVRECAGRRRWKAGRWGGPVEKRTWGEKLVVRTLNRLAKGNVARPRGGWPVGRILGGRWTMLYLALTGGREPSGRGRNAPDAGGFERSWVKGG